MRKRTKIIRKKKSFIMCVLESGSMVELNKAYLKAVMAYSQFSLIANTSFKSFYVCSSTRANTFFHFSFSCVLLIKQDEEK